MNYADFNQVELNSLANGRLKREFDINMKKIADNIADSDFPAGAKREMTIKISITPNTELAVSDVSIQVSSKFPKRNEFKTTLRFDEDEVNETVVSDERLITDSDNETDDSEREGYYSDVVHERREVILPTVIIDASGERREVG